MILLDMEMPKSCAECELHNYHFCDVTKENIENYEEKRAELCPIKAEIPKDVTNGEIAKNIFDIGALKLSWRCQDQKWWNSPWEGDKG